MAPLLSKLYLQHSKSSVRTKNAPFSLLKIFLDLTVSGDDVRMIPSTSSFLAPAYLTLAKDTAAFPLYYTSWIKLGFFRQASMLESHFFMESKLFSFLVEEGKPKLFVEERIRGFLGSVFLGPRGVDWLLEMLEELLRSSGSEDFFKSIQVESKALTVRRGGNRNGRFLVVITQAVDDKMNVIVLPEGREGWGWGRFAGEMSRVKAFFEATVVPLSAPILLLGAPRHTRWWARLLSTKCVCWT
jgi:hypothetical protein